MGLPGVSELSIIGGVCVLLFGGTKIPKLMKGLGEGYRDFKKATAEAKELKREVQEALRD
jgi:sec-independent protein translocase protein TatA